MKSNNVIHKIFIPIISYIIIISFIICFVYYYSIQLYTNKQASSEINELKEHIIPTIYNYFSNNQNSEYINQSNDFIENLLNNNCDITSHISNTAKIMALDADFKIIYPSTTPKKNEPTYIEPSLNLLSDYLNSNNFKNDSTLTIIDDNNEHYLININQLPTEYTKFKYIIIYFSLSKINSYVINTTLLVLCIIITALIFIIFILWKNINHITQPLDILCSEAKRIGNGDFSKIKTNFSLKEFEELRNSMNQMANELLHSNEVQKKFLQNISHELRNPLMSISGYAQGIEQNIFPSNQDAAHIILEESIRLTEIVNSLLKLSKLENKHINYSFETISINTIVNDCIDRFNGLAIQNHISLTKVNYQNNIFAYGSEELITCILENLLTNAIRYAKNTVTISMKSLNHYVSISVADDGLGINKKDMPHLFENCYKGDGGNFGIGLYIAYSAAEKMGGTLKAENSSNQGAIFTLILKQPINNN